MRCYIVTVDDALKDFRRMRSDTMYKQMSVETAFKLGLEYYDFKCTHFNCEMVRAKKSISAIQNPVKKKALKFIYIIKHFFGTRRVYRESIGEMKVKK